MDKFLDKFAAFPAKFKYLIVLAVCAAMAGAFVYWEDNPKRIQIAVLEEELQKKQIELQEAQEFAARYDEFKEELRQVDLKLQEALKKLPEDKEIPNLLDKISESAIDAGLTMNLFQPGAQEPRDFYNEVPIQIEMAGKYHNLATFADVISKMERIVTLRDFQLNPASDPEILMIRCLAVTFRQSPIEESQGQ